MLKKAMQLQNQMAIHLQQTQSQLEQTVRENHEIVSQKNMRIEENKRLKIGQEGAKAVSGMNYQGTSPSHSAFPLGQSPGSQLGQQMYMPPLIPPPHKPTAETVPQNMRDIFFGQAVLAGSQASTGLPPTEYQRVDSPNASTKPSIFDGRFKGGPAPALQAPGGAFSPPPKQDMHTWIHASLDPWIHGCMLQKIADFR